MTTTSSIAVEQVVACALVTQRARVRSPVGFFLTRKTNVRKLLAHKVPEYHLATIIIIISLRAPMTWDVDAPLNPNIHTYILPHPVTPSHTLFAKVIQRLRERCTFTVNRADCGDCGECRVTRGDVLNSRNSHVWDDETPMPSAPINSAMFRINVWAGIVDSCLIGPYLLPACLTGHTYLIFCKKYWANYLKMCHWTSVDASGVTTMAHYPILQVRSVITFTDISGTDG